MHLYYGIKSRLSVPDNAKAASMIEAARAFHMAEYATLVMRLSF
jgi:hypothetical protein